MMITRLHSGNENTRPHFEHEDLQRRLAASTQTWRILSRRWQQRRGPRGHRRDYIETALGERLGTIEEGAPAKKKGGPA